MVSLKDKPGEEIVVDPEVAESRWNQHATMKSTINSSNVGNMELSWHYATPTPVSHAPVIDESGSAVFFGDWGGTIYKVDRQTGNLIWENKVEDPMEEWPWHGFAGTGVLAEGKLIEASVEGNAFALDAATGNVLWETSFAEDEHAGNLSELFYYNGLVYIGLQSVEEPPDIPCTGIHCDEGIR